MYTPFIVGGIGLLALFSVLLAFGFVYIPHHKVGIVEKRWSSRGHLKEGQMIALGGEAGFQAKLLRGGLYFGYYPWQYRVHRQPLVLVGEGKIGYVYARDGQPLEATQTLARTVDSNHFQDADAFMEAGGQRGRQRAILREGLYAINLALFVVITEDYIFSGPFRDQSQQLFAEWRSDLAVAGGFAPVIIGHGGPDARADSVEENSGLSSRDSIGVVTVHDGPPILPGEIIAPEVSRSEADDHSYFQSPEAFLRLGGRRGMQLQVLTDGSFFLNRWFATVEVRRKTLIPIGYVGVVVSFYGRRGDDLTGEGFRYGEQVERGHRGVWRRALPPGKYSLNPYAQKVELVPTVNFVLRWITGRVEAHRYDIDLRSIELITADGYEPILPLSLVLHIDYQKAPRVVQRFGDVKRLISQTLDPILSSYFRDIAQSLNMLDLLTRRDEIQKHATAELGRRFKEYDINCIAVLIGRPESRDQDVQSGKDPIERLFDQLRMRRLAEEQIDTFAKREEAAKKLTELKAAEAAAEKQAELTQTRIDIEISGNKGEAELAEQRRLADCEVVRAQSSSRAEDLRGRGEASRIARTGDAESRVFQKKIAAYGDPRLFALNLVAERLSQSRQPLVPERMLVQGADGARGGLIDTLMALLVGDKIGVDLGPSTRFELPPLEELDPDEATALLDEATRTVNGHPAS